MGMVICMGIRGYENNGNTHGNEDKGYVVAQIWVVGMKIGIVKWV